MWICYSSQYPYRSDALSSLNNCEDTSKVILYSAFTCMINEHVFQPKKIKLSNVLPLNLLYFKTICLIMHDVFNNVTPPNVSNLFSYSSKIHHHNKRFSMAGNFYPQYSRMNHLKNSFSSIGAKIWNSIPTVIMLYLNINLRTSYRIGYWTFWHKKILMLPCTL